MRLRKKQKKIFILPWNMEKLPEFYPDSDDTYLMIDSISKDLSNHRYDGALGFLSVEIGPGGGLVSKNFLKSISKVSRGVFHLAVDVNVHAVRETRSVCHDFGNFDCILGDAFGCFRPSVRFDIIISNPPYVPSSPINGARCIRASYAGGELGREFIDAFLPQVAVRLKGTFYFLLEKRNNVSQVCEIARESFGLHSELVLEKRIPGEHLFVFRFY